MKKGIMNKIEDQEYKQILLDVLTAFDQFCRKNHLRYSLDSGTLIGAVRHKGFIPWDDDIDVIMPRKDYDILVEKSDELPSRYRFISIDNEPNYSAPLAKIYDSKTKLIETEHRDKVEIGAYVDIFVLDYIPEGKLKRSLLFWKASLCKRIWGVSVYAPKTDLAIEKALRNWALKNKIGRKCSLYIEKIARKQKKSKLVCRLLFNGVGYRKNTFNASILDEYIDIQFEGKPFKAFSQYDLFLRQLYGDYMKLPPEDKRDSNHNFTVELIH